MLTNQALTEKWTEREISLDTYAEMLNRGVDFERIPDEMAKELFDWFNPNTTVAFRVVGGGNVMWTVQ